MLTEGIVGNFSVEWIKTETIASGDDVILMFIYSSGGP